MTDNRPQSARIVMYGTEYCSYCAAARMLLKKKGVDWEEISISGDEDKRREMMDRSGGRTVPQIFIDGKSIGGFDDLYSLEKDGRLDAILSKAASNNEDA